jgi:uncharacterized protein YodC (DUF2158 family)
MEELKIGDVVRLKSGGPLMTVMTVGELRISGVIEARCIWFAGTKQFDNWFRLEVLEQT